MPKHCVGVVIASENYPYSASNAQKITIDNGINCTSNLQNHISFAGVSAGSGNNKNALFATGGRVLVAVGIGDNLKDAQKNAYTLVQEVNFKGAKMRKDIANKALV